MFIGEYYHLLDEKGRLAIPSKFRPELKRGAVVTRGLDGGLFLYPKSAWDRISSKISHLPMGRSSSRAFARLMLAGAMDAKLDSQGRIIIPEYLRKFANLGKNVVIAGLGDRLEVWDEASWKKFSKDAEGESTKIAEQLGDLGI